MSGGLAGQRHGFLAAGVNVGEWQATTLRGASGGIMPGRPSGLQVALLRGEDLLRRLTVDRGFGIELGAESQIGRFRGLPGLPEAESTNVN